MAPGGFVTTLKVEFLPTKGTDKRWLVVQNLIYVDAPVARVYEVPVGFITDFASVPRIFWSWLPKAGEYAPAAVVHDWLYWWGYDDDDKPMTRGECDAAFRRAMADLGVNRIRRTAMWLAVRLGGGKIWNVYRKERP